ncbi:hypothetical protein N7471_006548 [Penicillium samsonianum]|uniref:uncharacterized protein n=1 Tax=Penicillium samsonianum TaxID=1882272 RepID=UPI002546AE40|nr:uncharacterized protein N7471_006548 [Penicillium samsonianum]KAJ6140062.1 hypothetical protein N7471_006548 [Penicillium samsonianum]
MADLFYVTLARLVLGQLVILVIYNHIYTAPLRFYYNANHIAEMIALLGPPPREMLQNSGYATEFFDIEGTSNTDLKKSRELEGSRSNSFKNFGVARAATLSCIHAQNASVATRGKKFCKRFIVRLVA